mmetsp:Transcript_6457/g.16407  ORF Transcript_6457/g.16407 Transcript_6457/m.16407 type:complete len:405 (-) Transcript_6457:224-1438(-)
MKDGNGNQRRFHPNSPLATDDMPSTYNYDYDEETHYSGLPSGAAYHPEKYPPGDYDRDIGRDNGLDHKGMAQVAEDVFDRNDLGCNARMEISRHQNLPGQQEIIDLAGDSDSDGDYGTYKQFQVGVANRFQSSGEIPGEKMNYDDGRRLTASKSPAFNRRSREFLYSTSKKRSSLSHTTASDLKPSTCLQQTSILDALGTNSCRQESSSKRRRDSGLAPSPWSSQSTRTNEPADHLESPTKDEICMSKSNFEKTKRRFRSQLSGIDVAGRRQLSQDIRSQRNDLNSFGDTHVLSRPGNKSKGSGQDEDDIEAFEDDASRPNPPKKKKINLLTDTTKKKESYTSRRGVGRGRRRGRGRGCRGWSGRGSGGNGFSSSFTSTTNEWQSTAASKRPNRFSDIGAEISF